MKKPLVLALSLAAVGANAETTKPWAVSTELGVIATSGNTETTSIQAKVDAKQTTENWQNQYILSGLFKEDQVKQDDGTKTKEKTAEKYFGSIKAAYQLQREHSNFFLYGSHTDDKFSAYRRYSTAALGYGTRLFDTETMHLDVEIGPGYFRAEKVLEDETLDTESGVLLRGAAAYLWKISESAEFTQTLSVESAEENTRTVAESALTTRINGSLQLKVGFNVSNDSDVAPDKKKTDTMTYVNLVYQF
jgi:putative salt-induced outer membrane protein